MAKLNFLFLFGVPNYLSHSVYMELHLSWVMKVEKGKVYVLPRSHWGHPTVCLWRDTQFPSDLWSSVHVYWAEWSCIPDHKALPDPVQLELLLCPHRLSGIIGYFWAIPTSRIPCGSALDLSPALGHSGVCKISHQSCITLVPRGLRPIS